MTTKAAGWTRHYYDAVEYYYWGPDKLECRRVATPVRADAKEVIGRLRRLEEPLNHILTLFFDLAPATLVQDFVHRATGHEIAPDVRLKDREVHAAFPNLNVTQPDLLFEASDALVSVEVKLASKSSLNQVLKYALLHHQLGVEGKASILIYLTERPFERSWPEVMDSAAVLRACSGLLPTLDRLGQLPLDDGLRRGIVQGLERMTLAGVTLADLKAALRTWEATSDGTLRRLCQGLSEELDARSI